MKKAFTLLELTIVIAVIAILSIVMIPRFTDNNLREAADQVISHIRYTQHLAMIDDRFDPANADWASERWQIGFWQCTNSDWYYIVGHDLDHGGGIGFNESAVNPSDKKVMFTSNACNLDLNESSEILLTQRYGITNIAFSSSCGSNKYIAFDSLGRPYRSTLGSNTLDLLKSRCDITFTSNNGVFTISIEPETGYVRLLSINGS